jgi:S-adenosylmethionine/arginine decarboxylase-like enzyme
MQAICELDATQLSAGGGCFDQGTCDEFGLGNQASPNAASYAFVAPSSLDPSTLPTHASSQDYEFCGQHLMCSYYECDAGALGNLPSLKNAIVAACHSAGATVLNLVDHVFPAAPGHDGNGYTIAVLLAESHATLHSWHEHRSCFVDVFCCGTSCNLYKFDSELQNYLKPKRTTQKFCKRQ